MSFVTPLSLKNNKGFTLIELLVVIAIIGILSSVVLASLGVARAKARDATRVSDLKNLQLAIELSHDTVQAYSANTNLTSGSALFAPSALVDITDVLVPTYFSTIFVDPNATTANGYVYVGLTAANAECTATIIAGGCQRFGLGANMETANAVLLKDPQTPLLANLINAAGITCVTAGVLATDGVENTTERCFNVSNL